jgi:short-subunit dehydrogenase
MENLKDKVAVVFAASGEISKAAAKYMIQGRTEGTILLLTPALSRSKLPYMAGITASSAAVEGLTSD